MPWKMPFWSQGPPNNGYGRTPFSSQGPSNNRHGRTPFWSQGPSNNRHVRTPFSSQGPSNNRHGRTPFSSQGSSNNRHGRTPGRCPVFLQVLPVIITGRLPFFPLCFAGSSACPALVSCGHYAYCVRCKVQHNHVN